MDCACNMYQRLGICWHTGYKPTFKEKARMEQDLPPIRRMKNRVMSRQELEEREKNYYDRPR